MSRSKWRVVGLLVAALAVGCGEGSGGTLGAGGDGGDGTTASAGGSGGTGSQTTSTTGMTASTSSGGGSGGAGMDCLEGGLYALADTNLDEDVVSMCKYKGEVLLIVNTAEA